MTVPGRLQTYGVMEDNHGGTTLTALKSKSMVNQWLSSSSGHKLAQGGKRSGAGRKSNKRKAEEKLKSEIAEEMLKAEVGAIMKEYIRLAKGGLALDGSQPSIIKDAVGKWIPAARQEIDGTPGSEKFVTIVNTFDANARRRVEQEAKEKGDA